MPTKKETLMSHKLFLDRYDTTTSYFQIFSDHRIDPNDTFLLTIKKLLMVTRDVSQLNDALKDAEKINLNDINHNLTMIFLSIWSEILDYSGNASKAKIIRTLATSMISNKTMTVIKSELLLDNISHDGNISTHYKEFEQIINKHPINNIRGATTTISYYLELSRVGYASVSKLKYNTIIKFAKKTYLDYFLILVPYIQLVETGNLKEAQVLKEKMLKSNILKIPERLAYNFNYWDCLLDLLLDQEIDFQKLGLIENKKEVINIFKIHLFLKEGKNEKALELSKKVYAFISKRCFCNFAEYTILRTELVNKNTQAAKNILAILKAKREHYLDDFFSSRIYLLDGEIESAIFYYNRALKECKKFKAENRLDLELTFASEIKLIDFKMLTNPTSKSNTKAIKTVSTIKEQNNNSQAILIGECASLKSIKASVDKFSNLEIPVLITGETGTGKEIIARLLHENSSRADEPFIPINCGAISESLLQSELFGHKVGAFTGAATSHKGIFETANNGTVFLDEIGEINEKTQVALLRVLETLKFRPIGSAKALPYHCRILAATNAPLEQLVSEKKMRKDLYYRLKRLEIVLPPLRERKEDTILLAQYFLQQNRTDGKTPTISKELRLALLEYSWPGNIRELKNEIEKLVILNSGKLSYELEDFKKIKPSFSGKDISIVDDSIDDPQPSTKRNTKLDIAKYLKSGNGQIRRLMRIKELFEEHNILTRKEIAYIENISTKTAGLDLKILCDEGFIFLVKPNNSVKLQYFKIIKGE